MCFWLPRSSSLSCKHASKHRHWTLYTRIYVYNYIHIIFRQNFGDKKYFAISEKTLWPRLFITYPKSYAKETPFMALLLIYIYISIIHTLYIASFFALCAVFWAHYIHVMFSSEIDVQYRKAPVICWCIFITVPQLLSNSISYVNSPSPIELQNLIH